MFEDNKIGTNDENTDFVMNNQMSASDLEEKSNETIIEIREPHDENNEYVINELCNENNEDVINALCDENSEDVMENPNIEEIEQDEHKAYYRETINSNHNKRKAGFKRFVAACVAVSLFGGASAGISYSLIQNLFLSKDTESPIVSDYNISGTETHSQGLSMSANKAVTAVEVIDKVFPSVVNISTNVSGTANYFGYTVPYEGLGSGSGVIFNKDDNFVYIVTNNHVIENANEISISITGMEVISATKVGTEASSDLAVIKANISDFSDAGIENIVVAKFGDSDNIKVGESVIAIGNAFGEGKSVTGGMISVLEKSIEVNGLGLSVIQTSAPINEGNSGGALVNYSGEVIGINTAKSNRDSAEAMGYAIPSNTVKDIMNRLLVEGTTPKPYIGIVGSDITEDIADMYKLPIGVLVRQVYDGSGAQAAGMEQGDIIISFAGNTILGMDSLLEVLKSQKIGDIVELRVIRNNNESLTLSVRILDANNLT